MCMYRLYILAFDICHFVGFLLGCVLAGVYVHVTPQQQTVVSNRPHHVIVTVAFVFNPLAGSAKQRDTSESLATTPFLYIETSPSSREAFITYVCTAVCMYTHTIYVHIYVYISLRSLLSHERAKCSAASLRWAVSRYASFNSLALLFIYVHTMIDLHHSVYWF